MVEEKNALVEHLKIRAKFVKSNEALEVIKELIKRLEKNERKKLSSECSKPGFFYEIVEKKEWEKKWNSE